MRGDPSTPAPSTSTGQAPMAPSTPQPTGGSQDWHGREDRVTEEEGSAERHQDHARFTQSLSPRGAPPSVLHEAGPPPHPLLCLQHPSSRPVGMVSTELARKSGSGHLPLPPLGRATPGPRWPPLQKLWAPRPPPLPLPQPPNLSSSSPNLLKWCPLKSSKVRGRSPGQTSPPPPPLPSPPLENNDAGRRTQAWLRKPSWSSWVKVKPSLSSLRPPSPRELGAGMSQKHSGQAQGRQSGYQK
eukprot:XP_022279393.1 extensin isoform X2 [Canis lupus familiaris]